MKTFKLAAALLSSALSIFLGGIGSVHASAAPVEVKAALATPLVQAGKAQTAFLKVSLSGLALPSNTARLPVNVAIVIDRSGSMSGEKMQQARQAATYAVNALLPDDIVSVVAFDHVVEVITPATRATDKAAITQAISRIDARGSTAIFAGTSKGAHEVRKFLDQTRVNRVILLSDGLANVGPSSPSDLGQLGSALAREGISVTTIGLGLGYNEDLMTQLAGFSDGNHAFVANASDLVRVFKMELGDVTSVVAQDVDIIIKLAHGTRPVRVLGRSAEIVGSTIRTRMNQLGSEQEKFILLEVEVPAGTAGKSLNIADVDIAYLNTGSKRRDTVSRHVAVNYSDSAEKIATATDKKVMKSAVEQVANQLNKQALQLQDEGKTEEARRLLNDSADYLGKNATAIGAPELKKQEESVRGQAANIGKGNWSSMRKSMREQQHKTDNQQKY
jgi:Ca-activated chloride channel family protein